MTETSADFSRQSSVPWLPAIALVVIVVIVGWSMNAWLDSHCTLGGYVTLHGIECVVAK